MFGNDAMETMLCLCALLAGIHTPCVASADHHHGRLYLNALSAHISLQCTITDVEPSVSTAVCLTRRFSGRERLDKGDEGDK